MALRLSGPIRLLSYRALVGGLLVLALLVWVTPKALALLGQPQGAASSHAGHPLRQPTAVTNGLVAWYPLDGNAQDYSGNSYSLTANAGFPTVAGKFGTAYSSDGSTQYLSGATGSQTNLTASLTLSGWVNLNNTGVTHMIMRYGSYYWQYSLDVSTNSVQFHYSTPGLLNSNIQLSATISLNAWHFVLLTYDGATVTAYLDGISIGTASVSGPLISVASGTMLVNSQNTYAQQLSSSFLDDLRIYNRVLSSSEITSLYRGSQPINCDQYCVGWWKLDEASGTTAYDSTANGANGNNLTLNGFTFDANDGWKSGVFGNALQFNNSNPDYLSIASQTFSSDFTFLAWVKDVASNYTALGSFTDGSGYGFFPNCDPSGKFYIRFDNANGTNQNAFAVSPTNLRDGSWHYVAFTFVRSTGRISTYVDGMTGNPKTINGTAPTTFTNMFIGKNLPQNSNNFSGYLDDVRLYNRALTDYEIYDQYSAGR